MTFTSYSDVRRALEDPEFRISLEPIDEAVHSMALRRGVSGFDLAGWKQSLTEIPFVTGARELVSEVAEPWCHEAALRMVGLPSGPELLPLARTLFDAGARPWVQEDPAAAARLVALLPPVLGTVTAQGFVAVSQTLTAFLSNAWAALLEHGLREAPLEELLRFAGPSIAQFRYFNGQKVALRIDLANRDPERFGPDADRLNPSRDARGHLAFGYGAHACIGAMLVRTAASVAMPLFAQHYRDAKLLGVELPLEPVAIRKPLAVRIMRTPS